MKKAVLVPSLVLAISSFAAQAAVIYQDNFDGDTSTLNGAAPDVRPGTQTWTASTTVVIRTDGTIATTGGASAWLPVSLAANQIYTLTASVDIAYQASSTTPIGIGFTSNTPLSSAAVNLASSGDYGILQTRRGGNWAFFEGDTNNGTPTSTGTGLFSSSQDNYEIKLVLDTSAVNWTLAGYMNGVQVDLNGAGTGMLFTYTTNPSITGVGISYASNSYVFESFTLSSDVVPEPQAAALIAAGGVALTVFRRRSKVNS
jgi:hypothetical protein